MLQQPLNKRDIVTVGLIDFGRVPFPEAVSADTLIAKIIAYKRKLLLHGPLGEREDALIVLYTAAQAKVFDVLLDDKRHGERTALLRLLLDDFKMIPSAIVDYIAWAELQNIADAQAQVSLKHKRGRYALIRAASGEALSHGGDYFLILLGRERDGLFIHNGLL